MPKDMKLSPGDLADLIAFYLADEDQWHTDGVSEGFMTDMLSQQLGMGRLDFRGLCLAAVDRGQALARRWHEEFREEAPRPRISAAGAQAEDRADRIANGLRKLIQDAVHPKHAHLTDSLRFHFLIVCLNELLKDEP